MRERYLLRRLKLKDRFDTIFYRYESDHNTVRPDTKLKILHMVFEFYPYRSYDQYYKLIGYSFGTKVVEQSKSYPFNYIKQNFIEHLGGSMGILM